MYIDCVSMQTVSKNIPHFHKSLSLVTTTPWLGNWIAAEHAEIKSISLEAPEMCPEGEEKVLFLKFLRSMLRWLPEERKTAKELLKDPWLQE